MKSNRHGCAAMIAVCLATLGLADPTSLVAQDVYPSRAISIVVPYTSGGGVDSVARLVAEGLRENLGQSVIVDNVPGASGMIGAQRVARADLDGYTLLLSAAGKIAVNPHLKRCLRSLERPGTDQPRGVIPTGIPLAYLPSPR